MQTLGNLDREKKGANADQQPKPIRMRGMAQHRPAKTDGFW
jgi:hypothetical protein